MCVVLLLVAALGFGVLLGFFFPNSPNWEMALSKQNLYYSSECVVAKVNAKAISSFEFPKLNFSQ